MSAIVNARDVLLQAASQRLGAIVTAITAWLTNEAHTVPADKAGVVSSYAGATGDFKILSNGTDVSASFALSTQANPQNLTVAYVGQTFTVTGGLDAAEDNALLTIRATGVSGVFLGLVIDKVFSLGKARAAHSYTITLSNDSVVLAADNNGVVSDYSGAIVQARVFDAGDDDSANWQFYVDGTGGSISYRDSDDVSNRTGVTVETGNLGGSNLVLQSQRFDQTTDWSAVRATITANWWVAPDGTITADKFAESTDNNSHALIQNNIPLASSQTYNHSIFFRRTVAGGISRILRLRCGNTNSGVLADVRVDTATGALVFATAGLTVKIEPYADPWYRVSFDVTTPAGASASSYFEVYSYQDNGATGASSYAGDGVSGFGLWGAQISLGAGVTEYAATTTSVVSGATKGYLAVQFVNAVTDSTWIDITARRIGYTSMTRRFSVGKARGGTRGSVTAYGSGSAWSDTTANNAITTFTGSSTKVTGDVVTISNGTNFASTKYWNGTAWTPVSTVIDGNLVVQGTITTQALAVNAATAASSSLTASAVHNFTSTDTSDTFDLPATALSITTTGAPVKIFATVYMRHTGDTATAPRIAFLSGRLVVDGTVTGMQSGLTTPFTNFTGAEYDSYATVSLVARLTGLSAGTHTIRVRLVANWYNSGGSSIQFGSNAYIIGDVSIVAEENKV